jgi:hypothetical protein
MNRAVRLRNERNLLLTRLKAGQFHFLALVHVPFNRIRVIIEDEV